LGILSPGYVDLFRKFCEKKLINTKMHELSITKQMIELITQECIERKIKPSKIITELGSLCTFKKESVLFYFDVLKKEYPIIENSELAVNEIKGKVKCNKCLKESDIDDEIMLLCPLCDSCDVEIIDGKEFIIKEIIT
jgi:hydrogenase nickel incorporation protein HypA/HybF